MFSGLVAINAQDYISVSGHVTDESNGDAIPGHEVNISADSAYSSTVLTNEAGFFIQKSLALNFENSSLK